MVVSHTAPPPSSCHAALQKHTVCWAGIPHYLTDQIPLTALFINELLVLTGQKHAKHDETQTPVCRIVEDFTP